MDNLQRGTREAPEGTGNRWFSDWVKGRIRLIHRAISGLRFPREGFVVDVAASNGELAEEVHSTVGGRLVTHEFDFSRCRESRQAGRATVQGDVRHLPFRDSVADMTVAFEIIEHFARHEVQKVRDEITRITKPGGFLLLSTPNRYSLESWLGLFRFLANGTVWRAWDPTHEVIYGHRSLANLLRKHFSIERRYGYYLIPAIRGVIPPWSFVITNNPVLMRLCFIIFLVARK